MDEASNGELPKYWKVKYYLKSPAYKIKKINSKFARNKLIAIWAPPITGAYYAILDIWGDKWTWVKDNQDFHSKIFCVCLGLTLLGLFVRGFVDDSQAKENESANNVLNEFIKSIGAIVEAKIDRFRDKIKTVGAKTNKFDHITQPNDQLKIISRSFVKFTTKEFNLDENQINITIMKQTNSSGAWIYDFCYQKWKHDDPKVLLELNSAAKACIESGEFIFIPDKIKAAKDNKFILSARDNRRGPGSAFVFPVHCSTPKGDFNYLISIITYGVQLCEEWETEAVLVTTSFLREMCRRYELELCLKSLKEM